MNARCTGALVVLFIGTGLVSAEGAVPPLWTPVYERALLAYCAPKVSAVTMAALVAQESGGDPYALDDDTAHVVYHTGSYAAAARLAGQLIAAGHSVDLGLAQVNSRWLPTLDLTVAKALNPCENLRAGSLVLVRAWVIAGPGALRARLERALAIYHSGDPRSLAGRRYAVATYAHAGVRVEVPAIPGGRLARWDDASHHGPIRTAAVRAASPAASPLSPTGAGLSPGGSP